MTNRALGDAADPMLTPTQLETLRKRLEDERSRIVRVLRATPPPAPPEDTGAELEESAQRTTDRRRQLEIAEREQALLAEVERALAKLRAGTYGVSEKTGAPIPYERLAAVPWARHGVDE